MSTTTAETHTLWLNPLTGGTELVPNERALDAEDCGILRARYRALENRNPEPRVGDFLRFADGVERRISFITPLEWLPECDAVQTSDDGSFYLGDGYLSFSGSLYTGIKREQLRLTSERKEGSAWFFHHDYPRASNGVPAFLPMRIYEADCPSTN